MKKHIFQLDKLLILAMSYLNLACPVFLKSLLIEESFPTIPSWDNDQEVVRSGKETTIPIIPTLG